VADALVLRGSVLIRLDRVGEAIRSFEEAVSIGAELGLERPRLLGTCYLARLGTRDPADAEALFEEHQEGLGAHLRVVALYQLFLATGAEPKLRSCHDHLRAFEDSVSNEHAESMRTQIAIYREIHESWNRLAED